MKIKVQLCDRDLWDNICIKIHETKEYKRLRDEDAKDELVESVAEKFNRWVKDGDFITAEFDLDAGTATVVERGRKRK